jgi:HK97 family phage major capsid protein
MWARRWPGYQDYVWLINADTTPSLDQLVLASSTEIPTRFIDYGPDGVMRMKGRPVLEVEYAATAFATGDIMLASLSQYQTINKGDVKQASSIHVKFTTEESAFRFTYRIDGKPLWHSALTPLHGSATQSPFVVMAAASA